MRTLEDIYLEVIYQQYFGCIGDAFDEDGRLTEAGEKANYKLCDLLQDLKALGIITNADMTKGVIDEIIEHSY